MTLASLLPIMCLISSRADLALKSQCVMPSALADEIDTQFKVLFSTFATTHCVLAVSVQCLLSGNRNWVLQERRFPRDFPWNVLLGDARLRISDFTLFHLAV